MTYPDQRVIDFLQSNFICSRCNAREPESALQELLRSIRPVWTPTFIFLDARGTQLRRMTGFLAPEEFLPELEFVLGLMDQLHARFSEAHIRFRQIAERWPQSTVAPEALFWAGTALYYQHGRDRSLLKSEWAKLQERFPQSRWWVSANVFPD